MKFLVFCAIIAFNLAFIFADENQNEETTAGESSAENVVDVAEDVRLNLCTGGKYPDEVAYVAKNFAPVSFCQRHCEDYPLLPVCTRLKRPPVVKNGCVCAPGFIRELNTDDCIRPEDCNSN